MMYLKVLSLFALVFLFGDSIRSNGMAQQDQQCTCVDRYSSANCARCAIPTTSAASTLNCPSNRAGEDTTIGSTANPCEYVWCQDGACQRAAITIAPGGQLHCIGRESCNDATLVISDGGGQLHCVGDYSCTDEFFQLSAAITIGDGGTGRCIGESSCYGATIAIGQGATLFCKGKDSCGDGTTIAIGAGGEVVCDAAACAHSEITFHDGGTLICRGDGACNDAAIAANGNVDIICGRDSASSADRACIGAAIIFNDKGSSGSLTCYPGSCGDGGDSKRSNADGTTVSPPTGGSISCAVLTDIDTDTDNADKGVGGACQKGDFTFAGAGVGDPVVCTAFSEPNCVPPSVCNFHSPERCEDKNM